MADETYRALRREFPAATALAIARRDAEAEAAGLPRCVYSDEGYDVAIVGETFTVRVEPDYDFGVDWLGKVHERCQDRDYIAPYCYESVSWPCVALPAGDDGSGTQGGYYGPLATYYDPGEHWEPYAPAGMARGPASEWTRQELVREGVRVRSGWTYVVTVTDEHGNYDALCGVDLAFDGSATDRSYLWSTITGIAGIVQWERAEAERKHLERMARPWATMGDPAERVVRVGDLVAAGQIAERCHVTRAAVSNWHARHADFPRPVYTMRESARRSPLWLWPEVRAWLDKTGRPYTDSATSRTD
jgi:hypothetical protein